jgi:hypothetical protein
LKARTSSIPSSIRWNTHRTVDAEESVVREEHPVEKNLPRLRRDLAPQGAALAEGHRLAGHGDRERPFDFGVERPHFVLGRVPAAEEGIRSGEPVAHLLYVGREVRDGLLPGPASLVETRRDESVDPPGQLCGIVERFDKRGIGIVEWKRVGPDGLQLHGDRRRSGLPAPRLIDRKLHPDVERVPPRGQPVDREQTAPAQQAATAHGPGEPEEERQVSVPEIPIHTESQSQKRYVGEGPQPAVDPAALHPPVYFPAEHQATHHRIHQVLVHPEIDIGRHVRGVARVVAPQRSSSVRLPQRRLADRDDLPALFGRKNDLSFSRRRTHREEQGRRNAEKALAHRYLSGAG